MSIRFLVEGKSEQAFLELWCAKIPGLPEVRVFVHEGRGELPSDVDAKPGSRNRSLLHQLPAKLRSFEQTCTKSDAVVVLIDLDNDDLETLRSSIENLAEKVAPSTNVRVCFAVEELEAFYLGDLAAIKRAYPNADHARARNHTPDEICGTWELFGSIIDDDRGDKVGWAKVMGKSVTVHASKSRSPSFKDFAECVSTFVPQKTAKAKPSNYRHLGKPKSPSGKRSR
jgi:Domain of unknown function (DUF4276)